MACRVVALSLHHRFRNHSCSLRELWGIRICHSSARTKQVLQRAVMRYAKVVDVEATSNPHPTSSPPPPSAASTALPVYPVRTTL